MPVGPCRCSELAAGRGVFSWPSTVPFSPDACSYQTAANCASGDAPGAVEDEHEGAPRDLASVPRVARATLGVCQV
jgi:hypothetical protein